MFESAMIVIGAIVIWLLFSIASSLATISQSLREAVGHLSGPLAEHPDVEVPYIRALHGMMREVLSILWLTRAGKEHREKSSREFAKSFDQWEADAAEKSDG